MIVKLRSGRTLKGILKRVERNDGSLGTVSSHERRLTDQIVNDPQLIFGLALRRPFISV